MHIYTLHIYIHDGFCRQEYWTATEINLFVSCILQYTASMLWTKAQLAPSLQEMSAWKHNGCAVLTLKSGILWPTKIKWKIHTPLFTLHIVWKVFKVLTSCLVNIYKIHPYTNFFYFLLFYISLQAFIQALLSTAISPYRCSLFIVYLGQWFSLMVVSKGKILKI